MKNRANEIVIHDDTEFQLHDIKSATLKRHYTVAVMNRYSTNAGNIVLHYDDFKKVERVKVSVHEQNNKEVVARSIYDFEDWSADWNSVASDARAKRLVINRKEYPYFIEVSYEISYKGTMHLPAWMPQNDFRQSVVNASFQLIAPPTMHRDILA